MSCNVIAMPSTLTTSFDAVKRRYVLPSKLCDLSVILANNSFVFRYREIPARSLIGAVRCYHGNVQMFQEGRIIFYYTHRNKQK